MRFEIGKSEGKTEDGQVRSDPITVSMLLTTMNAQNRLEGRIGEDDDLDFLSVLVFPVRTALVNS